MERRKRVRKRIIGPDVGKEWKRICLGWIRTVVLLILAAYLLVTYVVQRVDVYGDSMSPVLDGKDVLLVEKLTPKIGTLERFDMVVFRYQYRDIISNGVWDFRERQYRLPTGRYGSTVKPWRMILGWSRLRKESGRRSPLCWAKMSILFWETTGTIVQTAEIQISET